MSEQIDIPDGALDELEASGAFEAFYQAEARTLFRRLWLVTGNRAEAEELMQDAFLKVWERWDRVGGMDEPVSYLYRTAMNLFRKRYRRATLAVRRTVGLASSNNDFSDADDRQVVGQVLASLPPRQRAALVLTEMLGFTTKEAGVGAWRHGRDDPLADAPRTRCVPQGDGGRRCLGSRTSSNARAGPSTSSWATSSGCSAGVNASSATGGSAPAPSACSSRSRRGSSSSAR